jgi:hypothetical protein
MTVTLRRTQKLARALPLTSESPPPPDTALGDWYVNRVVVDRRPLLLFVASRTLFPMLITARDVSTLPERLPRIVAAALLRANMPLRQIERECAAMSPVSVAKTADRSVVGILVDFAGAVAAYLPFGKWDENTFPAVESRLVRTPCFASRPMSETVFPIDATRKALEDRWSAES